MVFPDIFQLKGHLKSCEFLRGLYRGLFLWHRIKRKAWFIWKSIKFDPLNFIDCYSNWGYWSECDATCGEGKKQRSRHIYKSRDEIFYGTEFEIWVGFGQVGSTENCQTEPIVGGIILRLFMLLLGSMLWFMFIPNIPNFQRLKVNFFMFHFISCYVYDKHNMNLAVLIFLKTYVCKHESKCER